MKNKQILTLTLYVNKLFDLYIPPVLLFTIGFIEKYLRFFQAIKNL